MGALPNTHNLHFFAFQSIFSKRALYGVKERAHLNHAAILHDSFIKIRAMPAYGRREARMWVAGTLYKLSISMLVCVMAEKMQGHPMIGQACSQDICLTGVGSRRAS